MLRRFSLSIALGALLIAPAQAGDPVPGVDVLLEQIPGGTIYTAQTDEDGNIVFNDLPPGQYRVYQDIERPRINVSGPAVFTPSDGDDIGTLTITGRAPITIDRIVARRLSVADSDRADAIPLSAEDLNSIRSNHGGIAAPGDISAEDAERDAIPMVEDLNSTRSNSAAIVPVDENTVRELLRGRELRQLLVPIDDTDDEDEEESAADDNR